MKKILAALLMALILPGLAFAYTINSKHVNETALVFHDATYEMRWIDAWGIDVVKYTQDFVALPLDDTTDDPTEWTYTATGVSTAVLGTVYGGELLITTAAADNDGVNMQLKGEAFQLEDGMPLYFGIKIKLNEITNNELFIGLGITDNSWVGGVSDAIYFEKLDTLTGVSAITEDAAETQTDNLMVMDTSYHIYEFIFDGTFTTAYTSGIVKFYIDGVLVATHTTTADISTDTEMTPTIEYTSGTGAVTATVDWIRVIQLR